MTGQKKSFFIVGYNNEGKLHIGYTIRTNIIDGDYEMRFRYAYGRDPQETEEHLREKGVKFTMTEHDLGDSERATVYWIESQIVEQVKREDWTEDSLSFFVPFDKICDEEFWRGLPREVYFQDSKVTANLVQILAKHLVLEKVG